MSDLPWIVDINGFVTVQTGVSKETDAIAVLELVLLRNKARRIVEEMDRKLYDAGVMQFVAPKTENCPFCYKSFPLGGRCSCWEVGKHACRFTERDSALRCLDCEICGARLHDKEFRRLSDERMAHIAKHKAWRKEQGLD